MIYLNPFIQVQKPALVVNLVKVIYKKKVKHICTTSAIYQETERKKNNNNPSLSERGFEIAFSSWKSSIKLKQQIRRYISIKITFRQFRTWSTVLVKIFHFGWVLLFKILKGSFGRFSPNSMERRIDRRYYRAVLSVNAKKLLGF